MEGMLCKKCRRWRPVAYCPQCDCASRTYTTPDKFDPITVKRNSPKEQIIELASKSRQEITPHQYKTSKPDVEQVSNLALPKNWVDKEQKFYWNQNMVYFNFGKHKNKSLNAVAKAFPDYLCWISSENFSQDIKNMALNALKGIFPSLE
jgi:hypothetical protein